MILVLSGGVKAQENENRNQNFTIRSFGLSMGVYNPELDYWKSDTNSVFRNAEYSTNFFADAFIELTIVYDLVGRLGIGYWQTLAETKIPKYGNTTMMLTGFPLTLDFIYYISPVKVAFITPYLGVGGEILFIQYGLNFEEKDNPDTVNGTSGMVSALAGLQLKLSKQFSIDLFAEFKSGSYQQSFVREVTNPDPEIPSYEAAFDEDISLTGPKIGLSLKYLLK